MLDTHIHNWILGGADLEVGIRLFMDHIKANSCITRIISKNPKSHAQVVKLALLRKANLPLDLAIKTKKEESQNVKKEIPNIRSQWPFLADQDCPPELKLLISDKITAYRNCVQEYDNMTNASTPQEQLSAVSTLVNNFIENHKIYKELKYYKDNKQILGNHPIFEQYGRLKDLRKLKTLELVKKKENLEHKIWRNKSEINKGNKPELDKSRQTKIKEYEMQLAEVIRLLE